MFTFSRLAVAVPLDPLREAITVLLRQLVDRRTPLLSNGEQIVKGLNVLMMKILENCNRSDSAS